MTSLNRSRIQISGILLASGASRRINYTKQLLIFQREYLINIIINKILESKIDELFVILGYHQDKIANVIDPRPKIVDNPGWKIGKSSSIKMGVRSVEETTGGVIFFLVDQPFINKEVINTLIDEFQNSFDNIIAPRVNGCLCNPVLFGRKYYKELMSLSGEQGGKEIINKAKDVRWIDWEDERLLLDIDTDEDYKDILRNYSVSSS